MTDAPQTPASSTDQTAEAPPVPAWPKPNFLTTALPHIGVWTQHFIHAEIPVMASTAKELEALRAIEDDVDANMLTAVIQADPLMTLKLLSRVASLRRPGADTETESISTSLVLMGISPFFRYFGPQRTVEDWLADQMCIRDRCYLWDSRYPAGTRGVNPYTGRVRYLVLNGVELSLIHLSTPTVMQQVTWCSKGWPIPCKMNSGAPATLLHVTVAKSLSSCCPKSTPKVRKPSRSNFASRWNACKSATPTPPRASG